LESLNLFFKHYVYLISKFPELKVRVKVASLMDHLLENENYLENRLAFVRTTQDVMKFCKEGNTQFIQNGAILFYANSNGNEMTHAAIYINNEEKKYKTWTSKLGNGYLITHNFVMLNNEAEKKYGSPKVLYCPTEIPVELLTNENAKYKVSDNDFFTKQLN